MKYTIVQTAVRPDFSNFNAPCWQRAEEKKLACVYKESSSHHPDVRVKLLYDNNAVYGMFQVDDRYVRATRLNDQEQVCNDSCVEFFIHPAGSKGYFSLEMNCIGTLLSYFIRNARRTASAFEDYSVLPPEDLALIKRYPSLSAPVEPEITEPVRWTLGFEISMELFTRWGCTAPQSGDVWRGMFYKCGDETSHPHWLSCAIYPTLNFHQPDYFGELVLE